MMVWLKTTGGLAMQDHGQGELVIWPAIVHRLGKYLRRPWIYRMKETQTLQPFLRIQGVDI
jgi:hypothetical protein